jgi:hypothetical protein
MMGDDLLCSGRDGLKADDGVSGVLDWVGVCIGRYFLLLR